MTTEEEAIIKQRLILAREAVADAELLLDHRSYRVAVNRLYYACFYAVSALLQSYGRSAKTHAGIRSLFSQHIIYAGLLSDEFSVLYNDLIEAREDSDYEEFIDPDPDETRGWLPQVKCFIDAVEQLLSTGRQ